MVNIKNYKSIIKNLYIYTPAHWTSWINIYEGSRPLNKEIMYNDGFFFSSAKITDEPAMVIDFFNILKIGQKK